MSLRIQKTIQVRHRVDMPQDGKIHTTKKEHEGYLHKVKYESPKHWCVLEVSGIICTGVIPDREIGAKYKFSGKYVFSAKFNAWQFQFDKYEKLEDSTRLGVTTFIQHTVAGVGPKIAEQIYNKYGKSAIRIMREEPDRFAEDFPRFKEHAQVISEVLQEKEHVTKITSKLMSLGLTPYQIGLLTSKFGRKTLDVLEANCFSITEIHGLGFITAATIADKIGIPRNEPRRIQATVYYSIDNYCRKTGSTCIEGNELVRECNSVLNIKPEEIAKQIKYMLKDEKIKHQEVEE